MPRRAQIVGTDGGVVCDACLVADSPLTRLVGLLGRDGLADDEGLLLCGTSTIHTWFMRFPIDAVFLDRDLRVVDVVEDLGPWRWSGRRKAQNVLELAAGSAGERGLRAGVQVSLAPRREPERIGRLGFDGG
jgi:uncharacterized membrane protein (UPF0127 family)